MTNEEISKVLQIINKDFHRAENLYCEILLARKQNHDFETMFQGVKIKVTNQYILFYGRQSITYVQESYLDKYLKFLDYFAKEPDLLELDLIKFGSVQDNE